MNFSPKRNFDTALSHSLDELILQNVDRKKIRVMPPSFSAAQKSAINQFVSLTQSNQATAAKYLKQYGWDTQTAANAFFSSAVNQASNPHKSKLSKLFDSFRENPTEEPNEAGMGGIEKMAESFHVNMETVELLVLFELVASPTLGSVTRDGFVEGLSQAGVSDPPRIASLIKSRTDALSSRDQDVLRKVYKQTFLIGKTPGSKSIPLEQAVEYWKLLLSPPSRSWSTPTTPWLEWYIEFLNEKWKKSVNKDMWEQTLTFANKTLEDESMSWWSEDSAWPGVIDDFVGYVKERRGAGEVMDVS